ncbi:hypothetical protein EI42_04963 [Thermosporothrix hazakensis]|uniref:Uncharacterized protein n=1 Tax=Thermosporothrix hazakensis TaxID=644383 RepID=A0A326U3V2_THEHA|nr:hypothetical protein EI42_04963 [Thermosporothrix hazakensis]
MLSDCLSSKKRRSIQGDFGYLLFLGRHVNRGDFCLVYSLYRVLWNAWYLLSCFLLSQRAAVLRC